MHQVELRSGALTEVEAVLGLWEGSGAERSATDDVRSLELLIAHDAHALIVAADGGRVVGTVIAGWDGWRGNLYRLVVVPEHRRKGLGRKLVAEGERRLAAKGARRVTALVLTSSEAVRLFWSAVGFDLDERIGRHVRILEQPRPLRREDRGE